MGADLFSGLIVHMVPIRLAQITKKFGDRNNTAVTFCPFKVFGETLVHLHKLFDGQGFNKKYPEKLDPFRKIKI